MKEIRNSAKAIILRNGCLLAIRNVDADGDWYILPGGGQQHGESLRDALLRECREEIGAEVRVGELKLVREYIGKHHEFAAQDGDAHQIEFMFECEVADDYIPRNGGVPDTYQTGVAWLPVADLARHRLYPKILKSVLQNGLSPAQVQYLGDVN